MARGGPAAHAAPAAAASSLNVRFACAVAIAYMHASGEGLDSPYGELVELCKDLIAGKNDVFGAADVIRARRV